MAVSGRRLALVPGICRRAVDDGETPGGVLLAGLGDEVLTAFAFGDRSVVPTRHEAARETIYDLASLTKPIATGTLVMQAVEQGLLNLMEPVGRWLPTAESHPVASLTPRMLLLHTSGLPAGGAMPPGRLTLADVVQAVCDIGPAQPPDTAFVYSDLGFHLLAALVERVFDEAPFADLVQRRVLEPLRMEETGFAVARRDVDRCAPTETADGEMLQGVVHDPVARQIGGPAGHAGLFGTADDLARYCRMILRRGECDGARVLRPATVDLMIRPVPVPGGGLRALAWDVDTQYSSPRGEVLPPRGVGHTGYTGPSLWIDPPSGLYIVLLTNRVHPDGTGDAVRLRRLVANVIAASVLP